MLFVLYFIAFFRSGYSGKKPAKTFNQLDSVETSLTPATKETNKIVRVFGNEKKSVVNKPGATGDTLGITENKMRIENSEQGAACREVGAACSEIKTNGIDQIETKNQLEEAEIELGEDRNEAGTTVKKLSRSQKRRAKKQRQKKEESGPDEARGVQETAVEEQEEIGTIVEGASSTVHHQGTEFTEEDIARISYTESFPVYLPSQFSREDMLQINQYYDTFNSHIPIDLYTRYREILLTSLKYYIQDMKLDNANQAELNKHIKKIIQELTILSSLTGSYDYRTERGALNLLKRSAFIFDIFVSRPSLLYEHTYLWAHAGDIIQLRGLKNDMSVITNPDISEKFYEHEYDKMTSFDDTAILRYNKRFSIIRIYLTKTVSDYRYILEMSKDISLSKLVMIEVLIHYFYPPFQNFLKEDKNKMLSQMSSLRNAASILRELQLQDTIFISMNTRRIIREME